MLDYEWGNPSMIMLSGDESVQESDHNRQIFYPYASSAAAASQGFSEATSFVGNNNPNGHFTTTTTNHHHHHHQQPQHHDLIFHHNPHGQVPSNNTHLSSLYDPRAYDASASYSAAGHHVVPHQASLLSLEPAGSAGFMVVPKSEPVVGGLEFGTNTSSFSRIGLNLGGRTYFSSSEDDFVNRIYRRSRAIEAGSVNSPRCQAEGCNADLTHAKHYHRRHKVCEFHSKAATVIAAGLTQRFCQQCSRFHQLSEFDSGKRSCRKRLADHNRRRRKSQQAANQELANKSQLDNARNSSLDNLARSPSDSGPHSSSSVTVALSPPTISADCFRQRSLYQATTTTTTTTPSSSTSTGSLFFSKG